MLKVYNLMSLDMFISPETITSIEIMNIFFTLKSSLVILGNSSLPFSLPVSPIP